MLPKYRTPSHPGEIFEEDFLKPLEFWLNLQSNYDLWHAQQEHEAIDKIKLTG